MARWLESLAEFNLLLEDPTKFKYGKVNDLSHCTHCLRREDVESRGGGHTQAELTVDQPQETTIALT